MILLEIDQCGQTEAEPVTLWGIWKTSPRRVKIGVAALVLVLLTSIIWWGSARTEVVMKAYAPHMAIAR